MTSFEFTILMESSGVHDVGDVEEALFEAGCDDGLLIRRDGVWCLDFDREAETLLGAVVSAIQQVEGSGAGLSVVRVEPDEFVTAAEIARRTGRTRESIRLLAAGRRGPSGFPVPMRGVRTGTRLWRWSEVASWMAALDERALSTGQVEHAGIIAAVNASLQLRRVGAELGASVLERLAG